MWKWVLALLWACPCFGDETLTGYAEIGATYRLIEIAQSPAQHHITLEISATKIIAGQAPCNRYSVRVIVPRPWFELSPINRTKRACPALALEAQYFELLARARLIDLHRDQLILSDEDGPLLIFQRDEAPRVSK